MNSNMEYDVTQGAGLMNMICYKSDILYSYMLIIVCFLAVRSWVKLIREKVGDFFCKNNNKKVRFNNLDVECKAPYSLRLAMCLGCWRLWASG